MRLPTEVRPIITRDVLHSLTAAGVRRTANAHLYDKIVEPGTVLRGLAERVEVDTPSALVLVDLMPDHNWAHPCEWRLYRAGDGRHHRTIQAHFPPGLMVRDAARTQAIHRPVAPRDIAPARRRGRPAKPTVNSLLNHPGQRFAILFSGASNNRHVNDLEFLYRTLVDRYGPSTMTGR